jgi:hypothetical protein
MVSGHTQAVDSAPVKASASTESVVYLKKVEEENQESKKKNDPPTSVQITGTGASVKASKNPSSRVAW